MRIDYHWLGVVDIETYCDTGTKRLFVQGPHPGLGTLPQEVQHHFAAL